MNKMSTSLLVVSLSICLHAKALTVMIDPGHGGTDTGAVQGKAKESEITLKVSLLLKQVIDEDNKIKASLTRTTDKILGLPERVQLAEKAKADLFVSIHANAAKDKSARGVEFYFQNHLPADEESLFLASVENKMSQNSTVNLETSEPTKRNDVLSIIEDLKRQDRMQNSHKLSKHLLDAWERGKRNPANIIRQAPFYVVSNTTIPSVLVELGFLTNPREAAKLMDVGYQKEIAQKIYQGLLKYKDLIDNTNTDSLN